MTHVTITITHDGDPYEVSRRMDYKDRDEAVADAEAVAEFIKNYA